MRLHSQNGSKVCTLRKGTQGCQCLRPAHIKTSRPQGHNPPYFLPGSEVTADTGSNQTAVVDKDRSGSYGWTVWSGGGVTRRTEEVTPEPGKKLENNVSMDGE